MKKMIALLMFVLCVTACIEDGAMPPKETPDAMPPTEPDATPDGPTTPPDGCPCPPPPAPTLTLTATPSTITSGQSTTLSWMSTNTDYCYVGGVNGQQAPSGMAVVNPTATIIYEADCTGPGGTITKQVTVTVNPATSCDDGMDWTNDWCNDDNTCGHAPNDCGGMSVQLKPNQTISGAVTCGFWGGFGVPPEQAPNLGRYMVGNSWMNAPAHACSVDDCYDSVGTSVRVNTRIKWNGSAFQDQSFTGLWKGTWDGHNQQQ